MSGFRKRLEQFLSKRGQTNIISELTPDASTREYYRVQWNDGTAIACVYPQPFGESGNAYLDVTRLFLTGGLPVAEIYDHDEELAVVIQEDFGDRILRDVLDSAEENEREQLIDRAISLIAQIQAATELAYETGSIASKLRFDEEKLLWELNFFKEHYFGTYQNRPLAREDDEALENEFRELSVELESKARVLCHRDFHAANIMLDKQGELRIIDHQDARIGSPAYDLVSLLLDRVTEAPSASWLAQKRQFLLDERENLGLEGMDPAEFADEFRLQTVQRCLKAVGTFSFQSATRGKTYFIPYIKPMFDIVLRAVGNLDRFPMLTAVIRSELER